MAAIVRCRKTTGRRRRGVAGLVEEALEEGATFYPTDGALIVFFRRRTPLPDDLLDRLRAEAEAVAAHVLRPEPDRGAGADPDLFGPVAPEFADFL